jgi:hypothetical protein
MVQTEMMTQLYKVGIQLEEISEMLFEANLYEAGRKAKRLSEYVLEEYNHMQTPPAP